jgi:hypothetical protein
MKIAVVGSKWDKLLQKIINRLNKRRKDQLAGVERAQERAIGILQKRYGYTREQAASELKKHYSKAWLG